MGRTISVRLDGKGPATRSKDPRRVAEAEELKRAFLARPGASVVTPNPELPDEAREAARALLRRYCGGGRG